MLDSKISTSDCKDNWSGASSYVKFWAKTTAVEKIQIFPSMYDICSSNYDLTNLFSAICNCCHHYRKAI